jgi:hypothetical protein
VSVKMDRVWDGKGRLNDEVHPFVGGGELDDD